jgi:hypothetical protein
MTIRKNTSVVTPLATPEELAFAQQLVKRYNESDWSRDGSSQELSHRQVLTLFLALTFPSDSVEVACQKLEFYTETNLRGYVKLCCRVPQ